MSRGMPPLDLGERMRKFVGLALLLFFSNLVISNIAFAAYEVKGKGVSALVWFPGEPSKTEASEDEVIYLVDSEKGIVTRTSILNASVKDGLGSGMHSDNTVYEIIYDKEMGILDLVGKEFKRPQRVIKAFGKAGTIDGFETIVIGEDFICTSASKYNYFVLNYYKRTS